MKDNRLKKWLVPGMLFALTVFLIPNVAKAVETEESTVVYSQDYDIQEYWSKEDKKAPIKENYVFGGWYQKKDDTYTPFTETSLENAENIYAKFVPACVLSVKAQNVSGTTADTESTSTRIITSVDSKNYQAVGFEIYLANSRKLYKDDNQSPLETTKIYKGLKEGETTKDAEDIFGTASKYVGVWTLTDISKANYSKIIYVRPYWITPDGTKVEGLAKYVHIEDDYLEYLSVPVNLLDKTVAAGAAAGAAEVTYDVSGLELIEVEAGRMLPEMASYHQTDDKKIQLVGNACTPNQYHTGETLYANLRFKRPGRNVAFTVNTKQFCNWDEQDITVNTKWDVNYHAGNIGG